MGKKEIADFLFMNFDCSESLDEAFLQNLEKSGYNLESTLITPKGRWEIYTREDSRPNFHNVLSLYYQKDVPMNLFSGITEVGTAEMDALTISRNIMEHPGPLRQFHGGHGAELIGIPLCVAATGAILWGVASLPEAEMRTFTGYIMFSLFPLLMPALGAGYVADYLRTKSLSHGALNYDYAQYAISRLKTEVRLMENAGKDSENN